MKLLSVQDYHKHSHILLKKLYYILHIICMYIYAPEESGHTLHTAKNNFSEPSVSRILLALL